MYIMCQSDRLLLMCDTKRDGVMDYKKINRLRMLGLIIAYYRKSKGMTQQQLADAVQISRAHMSNIEAPNVPTSDSDQYVV